MTGAFLWGLLGACSLVLGAFVVDVHEPQARTLGLIMGFGSGVLMSAVSFELVEEAATVADRGGPVAVGLLAGTFVYFLGDRALEGVGPGGGSAAGSADHVGTAAAQPGSSAALGIVLGAVLDGIPESAVLGLTLAQEGTIGVAMLVAVFVSNLPESIAASSSLEAGGWASRKVRLLWATVAVVSAVASAAGYVLLDDAPAGVVAFVLAFAGGAILCMLTSTMVPEAYQRAGRATGLAATLGFAVAFFINWADR